MENTIAITADLISNEASRLREQIIEGGDVALSDITKTLILITGR